MKNDSHLEEVPDRRPDVAPLQGAVDHAPGPVVYAPLRPPATFCITLRVKYASCLLLSAYCFLLYCAKRALYSPETMNALTISACSKFPLN